MSRITIRSYHTNGPGYINAEIIWNPADPTVETVSVSRTLQPSGEIASLAVIPSAETDGYITVPIYPEDVPEVDVFSLPVNLADPLPDQLIGAQLPSLYYSTPYTISALPDTELGFRLSAGPQPLSHAGPQR
jgi:hypothetical protein